MKDNPILVVITYLPIAAQGREIDFAIEGWRRHFKANHLIVIVGENLPVEHFKGDDIVCIESPRVPARQGQYRQHLDYVNCMRKVHAMFPDSEGFIHVGDDCYAVNDFTLADVKQMKYIGTIDYDPQSPNDWRRDAMKTQRKLKSLGYPYREFTTHVPIWYDWDNIEALWRLFDMDNESYVVEDLYYNYFYPVAGAVKLDGDDKYKCAVTSTRPDRERLMLALKTKIWITNNPDGWTRTLVEILNYHYNTTYNY